MSLQNIQQTLPDYAKYIKLNLSSLLNSAGPLTKQQFWGVALASAITTKNQNLIKETLAEAKTHLSTEAVSAAKIAAVIMGMNNIYYRFTHSVSDPDFAKMPANLRMTLIGNPGIDKKDFELFSLAVSAINGCTFCMDAHQKSLIKLEVSKEQIQFASRIAAIMHSVSVALFSELQS